MHACHEGREAYKNVLRLTQVNGSAKVRIGVSEEDVKELKNKIAELEKNFNSLKLGVVRAVDMLQSTAIDVDPQTLEDLMEQLCSELGIDIREIRSTKQLKKAVTGKEEEKEN
jgi:ribosomal protein L7Ae-like RNA K-turn-binding protein